MSEINSSVSVSDVPEETSNVKTLQRKAIIDNGGAPAAKPATVGDIVVALQEDPLYQTIADVVYWRDPIRSGLVFAILSLGWFLVAIAEYSVVTLVGYLYLALFAVSFALVQYSNVTGKGHPLRNRLGQIDDLISRQGVGHLAETAHKVFDVQLRLARDALFFTDVAHSLKALGLTALILILGSVFTIPTLVYIKAVLLFLIPRVYEEKKALIDGLYAQALAAAHEKLGPVLSKVPFEKIKLKHE